MDPTFREQLLAAADQAAFPADLLFDPETGADVLDEQAAAELARLFDMFGVTGLQTRDADVDRIINTACTLSAEVAADVAGLDAVQGRVDALDDAGDWHPDYRAYVQALWQGDRDGIARFAGLLGLQNGIPNGSSPLKDGPLA